MGILQLLASDNFIAVNRTVARAVGLDEAVLLGELASEYNYYETHDMLDDGYFYSTVENVEEKTTLSDHRQRTALKTLQDAGILEVKRKGIPARRYIRINEEQVIAMFENKFFKNCRTRVSNIEEQEVQNLKGNNNRTNDTREKDKKKDVRHKYGEYQNVLLSDDDLAKLQAEFPHDWQDRIERLSAYMASTGRTYKNHLATIRNWARRNGECSQSQAAQAQKSDYIADGKTGWACFDED